jgi:predicted DNA-binding protein (MmcQ/YjbR family)
MARDVLHDRLLELALSLPEATEDWPWGSIHCKVRGKIFVSWGRDQHGVMSLGVRTSIHHQAALVATDPDVSVAKYVGKYGGIDIRLDEQPDWEEVEDFIVESYRIIAPKRLSKTLDPPRSR